MINKNDIYTCGRCGPLYVAYNSGGGWFRLFGIGLTWVKSETPMLFSERMGYRKKINIFGYRIGYLKP